MTKKREEEQVEAQQQEQQEDVKVEATATEAATEEAAAEAPTVEDELAKLRDENAELHDKYIRKVAEFDNYRKNAIKERAEIIRNGGERLLVDMLGLVDDFERAFAAVQQSSDVASLKEGVELIYNKFVAFLAQNGVKAIDTENAEFNTDFHEAVTMFPAPTEEQKNKVIDCVSKGYTMNDKVIRFAKVVVGK